MNKERPTTKRQLLKFAVIAVLAIAFMLAATSRNAYAAQQKNVPFEEYMSGINNGIALMNTLMELDLEEVCAYDQTMAAQYRKEMSYKAYTKTVSNDPADSIMVPVTS